MVTLLDALSRLTVPDLKPLVAWLPQPAASTRKNDLIDAIVRGLEPSGLRKLWSALDETQQLAVAEALHSASGAFDADRFSAKYGRLPEFATGAQARYAVSGTPTRLALLLLVHDGRRHVPSDLRAALEAFVPVPERARIAAVDALPSTLHEAALTVRLTEREAAVELAALLRLAEQGRMQVGDKTSLPTTGTLRLVAERLADGDFYADDAAPRGGSHAHVGPIKAYAWPMLLQAAALAQRNGSKLALTPAGLKALGSPPAQVLRTLWQKWTGSTLLDEFSRIDEIKGQRAAGRVMTAVVPRREAVAAALQQCPAGAWIALEEFSRFMRASGHGFEVAHDPWKLYIAEARYGSLGYDGAHGWAVLQYRYLLCLLFEYAATLGIIDVAYIEPQRMPRNFKDLWGADDLEFLSRYDGLAYFRITPLGAWCMGATEHLVGTEPSSRARLSVLPSLAVQVHEHPPSAEEAATLDTWGVQETPQSWRLDRQRAVVAIERGHDPDDLRTFLQSRDDQPLPETAESFIATSRDNATALKVIGTVLLVECRDEATAELIASHKLNAGLCQRVGARRLAVPLAQEAKFRALVRTLGLGMPA